MSITFALLLMCTACSQEDAPGDEVAEAINASEANVRAAVPAARLIYIEPDLKRTAVAE